MTPPEGTIERAKLMDKLRKVMALTTSPNEGEAAAASAKLAELLTQHNLGVADLEKKGAKVPGVEEHGYDLGKAAFKWKLDLAKVIATHFFCYPMVDDTAKTVKFVGRPDNVESLSMLYGWLIDQIKRVSGETRKEHQANTGEHVDPLRWQVGFGIGAASRIGDRLAAIKKDREEGVSMDADGGITSLVLHHTREVSDYMEDRYGWRPDGRMTKYQQESQRRWEERKARLAMLRSTDIEAYYAECPWDRPKTAEEQAALDKREREWEKREERNSKRRTGRSSYYYKTETEEDARRRIQTQRATSEGFKAADRINLQPFVDRKAPNKEVK